MRRFLAFILLFGYGHAPAFAEPFSFEGFSLGMPRSDATEVLPEIPWQQVMRNTPSEAARKEFTSRYLGREARVSIDLDREGLFVRTIGFTFLPQTDSECMLDAVGARVQLERLYGAAAETSSESTGRRAKWSTGGGVTIRWMEACAIGARQYFITYAKPAG